MDILDKLFKVKPVIEDEENFSELEKKNLRSYRRRIKEANEEISKLESRIKELREIEQEKKVLFPFQKNELLLKELELLEIKFEKGANISRINDIKGNEQKVEDLGEIKRELKKRIIKKEREQKQFRKDNFNSSYKGIGLFTDPREQYQEGMETQKLYKQLARDIGKLIGQVKESIQLRNRIGRIMKAVGDRDEARRLLKFSKEIDLLSSLKASYEGELNRAYFPQLQKIEKKLEEWRKEQIERLEAKEELKSAMLELE